MNNRLTIQDLAVLLAEHTGKDRVSTERFLREFIVVVSEGVIADKLVKVKGLGTFKIVPVEKRESIHVNTGERFVIPEHYKFSFLPDKELRELVNKPFSFFETTELSDSADFSDMDVSEEEDEEKETEDETVEEVMPEEQPLPEIDEEEVTPEELPSTEVEEAEPLQPQLEEVVPPQEMVEPEKPERVIVPKSKKKLSRLIVAIVISLLVVNTIVYLNRNYFIPAKKSQTKEPATKKLKDTTKVEDTSYLIIPDSVESKRPRVQPAPYKAPEPDVIDSVKISHGDRLTMIALKYYGSKHFWVYLYEHNKAKIKDPNNVPIGTVIEVPAPRLYGIDAHDRASVEKATTLQTKILSGK